jgi:O-antigen ligase
MTDRAAWLERTGFVLIALCLGLVQAWKLWLAQGLLFSLAALLWLYLTLAERRRQDLPGFFLPLCLYALLTLVSAAFSLDPSASVIDSRQLLMFLMVPVVARFARGEARASRVIDVIIAIGSAGALVGIVQFAMFGYNNLDNRPVGPLGHWMTFSGVLMLVICAAVARLLFYPRTVIWPAVALPALLVALAVTNTRNAWIGAFLAMMCLAAIRNWKLIILPPVLALVAFMIAPGAVQQRAFSIVDPSDPSNVDRIVMWKIGADMVRDYPLLGVGPEMIQRKYEEYRRPYPEAVNAVNPHLHNNPIQIAAERGLPALAAWLWFIGAALREVWRQLRARVAPAVAAAGLAAVISMLAAGMFEYNFGDSEFLMLFLGLITLPHAAKLTPALAAQPHAATAIPAPSGAVKAR